MNRRYFITAVGGATAAAASLVHLNKALPRKRQPRFSRRA